MFLLLHWCQHVELKSRHTKAVFSPWKPIHDYTQEEKGSSAYFSVALSGSDLFPRTSARGKALCLWCDGTQKLPSPAWTANILLGSISWLLLWDQELRDQCIKVYLMLSWLFVLVFLHFIRSLLCYIPPFFSIFHKSHRWKGWHFGVSFFIIKRHSSLFS